jgi:Leucine-rich repeat (LRR) protein
VYLVAGKCCLTGRLADYFSDLSDLRLYGPIPASIGLLVNLQNLHIARNGFSGSIPEELGKLGQLQSLDVSNNSLSGRVPAILGDLPLTSL